MTDVPTSRAQTIAVLVLVASVIAGAAQVVVALVVGAVRLAVGISTDWAEAVLIGGTLALTAACARWLAGRVRRDH